MLFEAPDAVVFIDPLVPDALWPALDERVAGRPVVVLTTIRWHGRSRDAVIERYDGAKVRHDAPMPAGVEAIPVAGFGETIYWLPEPRALVPGDRLIGDGAGGARMCPPGWLGDMPERRGRGAAGRRCSPLLDLPVEHLLLSHWEPVVGRGREALAAARERQLLSEEGVRDGRGVSFDSIGILAASNVLLVEGRTFDGCRGSNRTKCRLPGPSMRIASARDQPSRWAFWTASARLRTPSLR